MIFYNFFHVFLKTVLIKSFLHGLFSRFVYRYLFLVLKMSSVLIQNIQKKSNLLTKILDIMVIFSVRLGNSNFEHQMKTNVRFPFP